MAGMKELCREPDQARMGLIQSLLESRGIATRVLYAHENDTLGLQHLSPPRLDPTLVVLDEAVYEAARALLREHFVSDPDKAEEERSCPACGEINPGNFELCWSCGKALV